MDSPLSNAAQIIHQLVQDSFNGNRSGVAYGQKLLQASVPMLELNTEQVNIGLLPGLICRANKADPCQAVPVTAAWQLIRLAAKLLDDVEDGEVTHQAAETINTAVSFLYLAQASLWKLLEQGVTDRKVQRLHQSLNQSVLQACSGQHFDLAGKVNRVTMTPDVWLEIAAAKSGALLAWTAWSGALVAGVSGCTLTCYYDYGYHLGILLQVADDFNGVWSPTGNSDLAINSFTLPVCYTFSVIEEKNKQKLEHLLQKTSEGNAVAESQAKQTMLEAGAQAYLLVVGRLHYRQALAALQNTGVEKSGSELLTALLDNVWPAVNYSKNGQ